MGVGVWEEARGVAATLYMSVLQHSVLGRDRAPAVGASVCCVFEVC